MGKVAGRCSVRPPRANGCRYGSGYCPRHVSALGAKIVSMDGGEQYTMGVANRQRDGVAATLLSQVCERL
jgi:hypothetical protein